jgi:hypothetical protein
MLTAAGSKQGSHQELQRKYCDSWLVGSLLLLDLGEDSVSPAPTAIQKDVRKME